MILLGIVPMGPLSNRPPSKHNTPESRVKTFFFVFCPLCWKYCFRLIPWGVSASSGRNKAGQSESDCVSCSAKAHISLIPRKKIASFHIQNQMYWNYKRWNNYVQHDTLDLTLIRQPGSLNGYETGCFHLKTWGSFLHFPSSKNKLCVSCTCPWALCDPGGCSNNSFHSDASECWLGQCHWHRNKESKHLLRERNRPSCGVIFNL